MVLFCWLVVVNLGELTDCPVFDGVFNFCQIYSGGTLGTSLLSHTLSLIKALACERVLYLF